MQMNKDTEQGSQGQKKRPQYQCPLQEGAPASAPGGDGDRLYPPPPYTPQTDDLGDHKPQPGLQAVLKGSTPGTGETYQMEGQATLRSVDSYVTRTRHQTGGDSRGCDTMNDLKGKIQHLIDCSQRSRQREHEDQRERIMANNTGGMEEVQFCEDQGGHGTSPSQRTTDGWMCKGGSDLEEQLSAESRRGGMQQNEEAKEELRGHEGGWGSRAHREGACDKGTGHRHSAGSDTDAASQAGSTRSGRSQRHTGRKQWDSDKEQGAKEERQSQPGSGRSGRSQRGVESDTDISGSEGEEPVYILLLRTGKDRERW
ncbi:hypothetical protein PBY51_003407 [Eleginops maclovinus]|nr:hypothetical protein PBY51_003407 [Eleginops maclovinus]